MGKFLVVKVAVGLIVIQGLVAQFLTLTGKSPYVDDDHYSVADKTTKGYCKSTNKSSYAILLCY